MLFNITNRAQHQTRTIGIYIFTFFIPRTDQKTRHAVRRAIVVHQAGDPVRAGAEMVTAVVDNAVQVLPGFLDEILQIRRFRKRGRRKHRAEKLTRAESIFVCFCLVTGAP